MDGLTELVSDVARNAESLNEMSARLEENSAATEQVLASSEEMGAQVDAVTAQAEDLARTAEQLQSLVTRFHAEVGAACPDEGGAELDAGYTDAYEAESAWGPEPVYVRRAS